MKFKSNSNLSVWPSRNESRNEIWQELLKTESNKIRIYWTASLTWVQSNLSKRPPPNNDQLPPFWGSILNVHYIKLPLNNNHHLSTTATNLGSRGCLLYTGLTVLALHIATSLALANFSSFIEMFGKIWEHLKNTFGRVWFPVGQGDPWSPSVGLEALGNGISLGWIKLHKLTQVR